MHHREALEPIVDFVRGVGISVEYGEGARGGFLPGVNIRDGVIHVDPDTLVGSGDVLHEAGHIAVVPRRYWPRLGRDIQADLEALVAEETADGGTADPQLVAAVRMGEFMSQAWSYAVARHLSVSQEAIFFRGSYQFHEYEGLHPMLAWLERGTHFGPLALAQAGMTGFSGLLDHMGNNGLPPFPHMTRWSID
ncbi:hypothetical protein [Azospirillum halopraeferens]|uniref:hypothetical protein n=1 Tax=Azospirillum halopraeferens TaxID=34010 RepID=UPI000411042D|nr:hypothetical protein [Azospirillum halopraeferens]